MVSSTVHNGEKLNAYDSNANDYAVISGLWRHYQKNLKKINTCQMATLFVPWRL